jgi:hypothetical protein
VPVRPGGSQRYGGVSELDLRFARTGRGGIPVPPGGRAPNIPPEVSRVADGRVLVQWTSLPVEPSVRIPAAGVTESGGRTRAWSDGHPTVASAALIRAIDAVGDVCACSHSSRVLAVHERPTRAESQMGARCIRDRTVKDWGATIRGAVLTRTGTSMTGGAGVAADLLSTHCSSENVCATGSSKWRKWVGFLRKMTAVYFPFPKVMSSLIDSTYRLPCIYMPLLGSTRNFHLFHCHITYITTHDGSVTPRF